MAAVPSMLVLQYPTMEHENAIMPILPFLSDVKVILFVAGNEGIWRFFMLQSRLATGSIILWVMIAMVAIVVELFSEEDVVAEDTHEHSIECLPFRDLAHADL